MQKLIARLAVTSMVLGAAAEVHAQSAAQAYPNKPIRIVVSFTSGGAHDIIARLLGERFTAAWGQPVIIDNKLGVDKMQAEIRRILKMPEVAKRLPDIGLEPVGSAAEDLAAGRMCGAAR